MEDTRCTHVVEDTATKLVTIEILLVLGNVNQVAFAQKVILETVIREDVS